LACGTCWWWNGINALIGGRYRRWRLDGQRHQHRNQSAFWSGIWQQGDQSFQCEDHGL
jgi:hypothetical protein